MELKGKCKNIRYENIPVADSFIYLSHLSWEIRGANGTTKH